MPKYPSVTCTLPEFAAWVRWWSHKEEARVLAVNRAEDPKKVRQSIGLLSDAFGRWLQTAEDFAKVCCDRCDATGLSKLKGKRGNKLPCSKCEGRGFIKEKEDGQAPKLRLATDSSGDAQAEEGLQEEDDEEPPTDGAPPAE